VNDPVALMLQFGFLAVLYLFLFWVARSVVKDLSRSDAPEPVPAGGLPEDREAPRTKARRTSDLAAGAAPRLIVVAAMGHEPGTELPLSDGATLGRSPGSDVHVDDQFASSAHARIVSRDGSMYVEDLGSTNGTYHNGRQLRRAERLRPADTIRIGDTEFRYQE
jgi:FHA domain-containing protein